jgi:hypothetical protein
VIVLVDDRRVRILTEATRCSETSSCIRHATTSRRNAHRGSARVAPNVVMNVDGHSALSGQYQGAVQVIAFTAAMTQWFLPVSVETIEIGDPRARPSHI